MPGWPKKDTLAQLIGTRLNLEEYLGRDLYSILESGKVKTEMLGFESSIDLLKKQANIRKKFGKGYQFDLDINKRSPMGYKDDFRIGLTRKF